VAAEAHESQKHERLCRYIARPAISEKRLSLSPQGRVNYQLKTPWKNGATQPDAATSPQGRARPAEVLCDDAPTAAKPTLAPPLATAQPARKWRLNVLHPIPNESAVRELGHPVLRALAHELTEKLRSSATINWQNRVAGRAK
jgi:hypothetical protein